MFADGVEALGRQGREAGYGSDEEEMSVSVYFRLDGGWAGVGGAVGAARIEGQVCVCEVRGIQHAGEIDVYGRELWGRRRCELLAVSGSDELTVVIRRLFKHETLLRQVDSRVGDYAVDSARWAQPHGVLEEGELAGPGGDV